jgi:hypothetical protein
VPFLNPVAPLILSHHERWDGKGYPAGLKGEDIPLGARILSVVDYFHALMVERPYHHALSFDAAIGLLLQEAGKGLDPAVVAKFIQMIPGMQQEAVRLEHPMRHPRVETTPQRARPATRVQPEPSKNVFENIALAHREIDALYEIAQAMGTTLSVSDTMAVVSPKLTNLVPFSCAALFLFDEETETLRCRFATGTDADVIQQVAVPSGAGLTGWVAHNRRSLVNARPSADLEAAGLTDLTASDVNRTVVFTPLGRLRPGVTPQQAEAEGTAVARTVPRPPSTDFFFGRGGAVVVRARPLVDDLTLTVRPAILVLASAVILVLLIACANVANLLLSRGAARQRELAIRAALGSSRTQLVQQLLTESILLSAAGGAAGLALAWTLVRLLPLAAPARLPRLEAIAFDSATLIFGVTASLVAATISGLVPALRSTHADVFQAFRGGEGSVSASTHAPHTRRLRLGLLIV